MGFDEDYFEDMKASLDDASFKALYMNEPIEREGLVYHVDELRRYFDCDLTLSPKTAENVWALCNDRLKQKDFSVRGILRRSNVETVVTTDDPLDDLAWHIKISGDPSLGTRVLPGFRPDKAIQIE